MMVVVVRGMVNRQAAMCLELYHHEHVAHSSPLVFGHTLIDGTR